VTVPTPEQLRKDNEELRQRLEEAEETLRAIHAGEVDAVVVAKSGEQVFTLESTDRPYRLLVECMTQGAAALRTDGVLLYCNRHFAELLGRPLEALRRQPVQDCISPDDRPLFEALLREGQTRECQGEITLVRTDGTTVPAYLGVNALRAGAAGLCLMVTDLSEQKRHEAISASEALTRSILEQTVDATVVCDSAGKVVRASRRAHELCGRNPLLLPFTTAFPIREVGSEGEPAASAEVLLVPVLEGGTLQGRDVYLDCPASRRVDLLLSAGPLRGPDGQVAGAVVTLTDITERKRAENALRESQERFRTLVEQVKDYAIFMIDMQGRPTTWNEGVRRVLGFAEDEFVGQEIDHLIYTPEDVQAGVPQRELALAAETGRANNDRWMRRQDGERFWASGITTALHTEAGEPIGFSKVMRDLTSRKQAEEALHRARDELERRVEERTAELQVAQRRSLQGERLAAIGQMMTGLAHESRNALQRSQACLTVLSLRLEGRPQEQELLARIQCAQDDLHRLYEEVREYAVPRPLDRRLCHLSEVWREAWRDLAPLREAKNAELREDLVGVDDLLLADPFQLKQVFRNLLENALVAGGALPRIEIRCRRAELDGQDAVRLTVRDNGPGFASEQMPRLFEPFYTTKVHGTGLGLAICKRIIEAHGGRIEVGTGPGAEIIILLPRREA
jgi:PAS domain S-box-containing protein